MNKHKIEEIIRFYISGIIGVIVGFVILYGLTEYLHFWYLFSSMTASLVSYVIGFITKKIWVFKNKNTEKIKKEIFMSILTSVFLFVLNAGLMYMFVDFLQIYYLISQIFTSIIVSVFSYVFTKKIFEQ